MLTFIAVVHVIAALIIVVLVLLQDSKGNGAFGMGGSGSQSLLGATGAQSLAAKMTVYIGIIFAVTSISLSYFSASKNTSVIDQVSLPELPTPATPAAATTPPPAETAASASPIQPEQKSENSNPTK
ncbi:MAG TPA: preprotein translocase subunit SecG [Pseudobdellovibrionaceae bacterium]|nr:preprotein translocase subunit SecG [Pseudobdellovibrionaceae bacterium]